MALGYSITDAGATANMIIIYPGAAAGNLVLAQRAGIATFLDNYVNDVAAAIGGVPISGMYRNGSVLQIRVL
jgi:hypothetical protein